MKWCTAKLVDICEINIGRTPSRSVPSYWKDGTKHWLSIADMSVAKYITDTKEKITDEAVAKTGIRLVEPNTVLLSYKLSVGKVCISKIPLHTNEAIAALPIKNNETVDTQYLMHALHNIDFYKGADRAAKGLTLNKEKLSVLEIPLPPLAEQRRIAAILDKAEEIKRKREAAIAKLDQLAQSTFVEIFGDPVENTKHWNLIKLGNAVSKLGSGSTPKGGDASYKAQGISLIRSLNVHDGDFIYRDLAYIDDNQADKLSNVRVEEGDVLLNITGASVARVCRVPNNVLPARVNQHVMIIRPNEKLNSLFLERLLLSSQMKKKLLQIGGSGATREAITKAQAEKLDIICPPLELQIEFSKIIERILGIKDKEKQSIDKNISLLASLQHQAFTTGFET